jgi:AcrR family transcriptional regulator
MSSALTTRSGALTPKGAATRQRIIEGATAEIREHGLAATTLDDIRARAHTSKGQLFHYFPGGKEELLLAVADREAQRVLDDQRPHLDQLDTWRSWQAWRDAVVDRYRKQGTSCPLTMLMTELGRSTPAARAVTTQLMAEWEARLTAGVRAMQEAGKVAPTVDPSRASRALLAGVQGGVTVMLAIGDISHLEDALDTMIAGLRSA